MQQATLPDKDTACRAGDRGKLRGRQVSTDSVCLDFRKKLFNFERFLRLPGYRENKLEAGGTFQE